jgi:hypothetical protein
MTTKTSKLKNEALDRAHTLMFAANLLTKGSSEQCAVVGTNPALVREWIEELQHWREQSQRETELLDLAINDLRAAQRLAICESGRQVGDPAPVKGNA